MAQRIVLSDDFDGSDATETVSFSLDGRAYEVDLNDEHVTELREFLKHYTDVGRRTDGPRAGRRKTSGKRATPGPSAKNASPRSIREWAAANGIQVSPRGRIPATVLDRYHQAGS